MRLWPFRRRDRIIDDLILDKGARYLYTEPDERLRIRTEAKRAAAHAIRRRAAQVDSGGRSIDLVRKAQ
jgi:hypothetical protein